MKTNDDWQWVGDEFRHAFATTDDPRVIAVIKRDDEWGGGHIDGDAYAPAFYWDRYWGQIDGEAGSTYQHDEAREILERIADARSIFQSRRMPWATVERYAWIFYGTTMHQVSSSIDQSTQVVILNTPAWREYVGLDESRAREDGIMDGDIQSWTAALDGEAYGIGYAVLEGHVLDDGEEPEFSDYALTIECWGFLGEDYAKQSAGAFEAGAPNLPEMLEMGVE